MLTVGSENGDELAAPGLQADFSSLYVGIFIATISGKDGDELAGPGLQADFSAICEGLFSSM